MRYNIDYLYLYIFGTIVFTVYGQLILKWQVGRAGVLPAEIAAKIGFLLCLFLNPWVLSGIGMAFMASVCWMAAMTKFELSHAYLFMSLAFVLVLGLSSIFFHEPVTVAKVIRNDIHCDRHHNRESRVSEDPLCTSLLTNHI
jgi:multidrug transporter EmrE-like cation transporter